MRAMAAPGSSDKGFTHIRELTQNCRDKLRASIRFKELMKDHWAENRLSDFNLWDASIGASARSPNSLDYRLKDDHMARKVLSDALEALIEWSAKCLQLCVVAKPDSEEPRPRTDGILTTDTSSTEAFDQDEPPITLAEGRNCVEELLESLVEMGTAIRQAGTASRLRRADRSLHKDASKYRDFKRELESKLLLPKLRTLLRQDNRGLPEYSVSLLQSMHLDPKALTNEQCSLLQGNLKRRHRFDFAKARAQHLGENYSRPDNEADTHTSSTKSTLQDTMLARDLHSSSKEATRHDFAANFAYSTSTSKVSAFELPKEQKLGATKTLSQAPPTTIAANTDYPEPPSLGENKLVPCPYCWLLLTEDSISRSQWK